jgi:hypothetical protein
VTLEEVDGVVSTRSFQMLAQWIWLGRVHFGKSTPEEDIAATLEFVRIADMCGVTGMESLMAERIKEIIIANPEPQSEGHPRNPDTNTHCLTSQNIISAACLPQGHPVRSVFAAAAVKGYLQCSNYKFLRESQEVPGFSADLLAAVKAALETMDRHTGFCRDPFTGRFLKLHY